MLRNSSFATHLSLIVIGAGSLGAMPASALAADAAKEAAASELHAGLAAKAATIEQVHMHLHHAVNCLVGPKGPGFDAKEANPCQNLGDGAIPDTTDFAAKAKLTTALTHAQTGLNSDNLAAAKRAAAEAQASINK
jgi:hypothetical protein